jgi:hypothetical protein
MSMNRASRKRANRRKKVIQDLLARRDRDGYIKLVSELLDQWVRQAEFRARVAFRCAQKTYENGQTIPAVWDIYRKKLLEAQVLEAINPETKMVERLREICRQAVARQMDRRQVQLGSRKNLAIAASML